jgi:F0F1-type ATP synthase assembly protein I
MSKNKEPQPQKRLNSFIKYTSIGFQMAAAIGVCTWIGVALDDHYQKENLFTVICSLLGVCSGIYLGVKDFIK